MGVLDAMFGRGLSRRFCGALEAGSVAQVVEMLAERPQLLSIRCGDYDESPLHVASRLGHLEIVRSLLQNAAPMDAKDALGGTPLHLAAHNGHHEVVALLVDHGAAVDLLDDRLAQTPLFSAAARGHAAIVELLLEKGADPNRERWG